MEGHLLISSSDWNSLCIWKITSHLKQHGGLDKKSRPFGVRQTRVGIPAIPHHCYVALSNVTLLLWGLVYSSVTWRWGNLSHWVVVGVKSDNVWDCVCVCVICPLSLFQVCANNNDIGQSKGYQPKFQEYWFSYLGNEYKFYNVFFIEVYLNYSVALITVVHQSDSCVCVYTHTHTHSGMQIIYILFHYGLSQVIIQFPVLYSRTLLFIHSIYTSLHLRIPNSQSNPLWPTLPHDNDQSLLWVPDYVS